MCNYQRWTEVYYLVHVLILRVERLHVIFLEKGDTQTFQIFQLINYLSILWGGGNFIDCIFGVWYMKEKTKQIYNGKLSSI